MKQYVAAYARVSSPNGRQRHDSQVLALKRYVKQRKMKNVRWLSDNGTGRNLERPTLQALLEDVRQGKVSDILVWKLDRLSRSLPDMLATFELCLSHGRTLYVITNNLILDAKSPFNSFLCGLFGLLGRLESDITSERIRAGQAVARAQGKHLGRPANQKKRDRIQRMLDKGMTPSEIARKLGQSRQSISQIVGRIQAA